MIKKWIEKQVQTYLKDNASEIIKKEVYDYFDNMINDVVDNQDMTADGHKVNFTEGAKFKSAVRDFVIKLIEDKRKDEMYYLIKSEATIDSIVERINKKQVK